MRKMLENERSWDDSLNPKMTRLLQNTQHRFTKYSKIVFTDRKLENIMRVTESSL